MITPVLFILFPLAVGVALMPLARKPKASVAIVCVVSMLLAALALFMPDDLVIQFAGRRFVFSFKYPFGYKIIKNLTIVPFRV